MIQHIISFSIHNKLVIGLLTIALIVVGIWSMSQVPLDAVPDITNNQVQVITQAPNLGTEDIEQFVTYPVEVAMANLPGVTEIRSVSRFGLSVVTIVFEDDMGTYLPRQLVSEQLTEVREEIPQGFGQPAMGPISTGLGEIYQYTLEVDSAHRDAYSLADLRTFQDWIVRRQMAMVPGVIEVNAFGGHIKQYEVAVNPDELKAIGITIGDVFTALRQNNQNTGGAYIEKDHYANFIRGEGLARSLEDIRKIVVDNHNGLPITIQDVAEVRFGQAVRYGAFTRDGKGEAVGGMILMLKDANSNDVITAVKQRMKEIQSSLPEGVHIEPFLDRSELITRTTSTVSRNLIEGALIVIFVLVFLLGNWRGGLIVASTIPLSLLFAFILMNVFDVWANLMSLGAIDFGIIVDGAVIIVEGTVFLLHEKVLKGQMTEAGLRDKAAASASGSMMNSAFFGQLIILIVFIPILALQGVEGKMFQPMALTFMFAMAGVMILCLTYVPMMSAWFLRVSTGSTSSWGDRFVAWLERGYDRVLVTALKRTAWIIGGAVLTMGLAVWVFLRSGGEFIPQLDEGDIAFHIILKPGSALSESIETSTRIEQILLENFPEVKHAMTRFGVADVPTDPMPMDIGDCFVLLKPRSEWESATTRESLIDRMKEALEVVPGVNYEFTQPIEMRFNELLTGVREDIAVKLFGEDLEVLASKAEEMGALIAGVPGVGDMRVEATSGLPQMTIRYDRHKLARYGLQVDELNMTVKSAFSGGKAGVIFEGEKRFDLVVRLDERHRRSIDDVKNLYINLPNGAQIPLREVADISYEPGPMQISRDNTNRRIYVGINVRGRDVETLVEEIRERLDTQLDLPPGYYIRYGGAFENLERASKRLQVVVPIALGLIFLLIFFALKSLKQSVMIYIAIPLAAIGGVFSLWLRDMPFSISAGVGFIVLFGVAVLNGLVLISSWNDLKAEGVSDLDDRIRQGARRRIRPILLTALTDILGFLPMAISTSAGAEVQRPLATVVIGGMISATLLTLFVLPILYRIVERRSLPDMPSAFMLLALMICLPAAMQAQGSPDQPVTSLDEAIRLGLDHNGHVRVARSRVEMLETRQKTAFNPDKLNVGFQYGQYNSFQTDFSFNLSQSVSLPGVYAARKKQVAEQITGGQLELADSENQLRKAIRNAWYELSFLQEQQALLLYQDSIFQRFLQAASVRYETQATNFLEKAAAETQVMKVKNSLQLVQTDLRIARQQLTVLLNLSETVTFRPPPLEPMKAGLPADSAGIIRNPTLALLQQEVSIAGAETKVQQADLLPEFTVGYFNQSLIGSQTAEGNPAGFADRFDGVQVGVSVPLFYGANKAEIEVARLQQQIARERADYYHTVIGGQVQQQIQAVRKYQKSLHYYESRALPQADLIITNARKSYESGNIGYVEYFQHLNQALDLRLGHLQALRDYNQAVIDLHFLIGQ